MNSAKINENNQFSHHIFAWKKKIVNLPSHDASDAVSVSVSFWLWSFRIPVSAGIIITGKVPLNPMPNSSIFSAVVAENYREEKKQT